MSSGNNQDLALNANLLDDKVLTAHNYTRSNYINDFSISNLNQYDSATITFILEFEATASPGSILRI